jgi:HD-like signal output (HDOD) protein
MHNFKVEIDDAIQEMTSLNPTVPKVLKLANDMNSSAKDIMKVIQMDPVLTAKALRLVNSAFFGLPHKITSLGRAVILLGINTVRNLALSCSVSSSICLKTSPCRITSEDFWKYSVGCAAMNQMLANHIGIPRIEQEEFFIAGLLHNIGKALLIQFYPDKMNEAIAMAEAEQLPIEEAESRIFGMDHTEIGARLSDKWGLPDSIRDAIIFYNQPEQAVYQSTRLLAIVSVYIKMNRVGFSGDYFEHDFSDDVWDLCKLDHTQVFLIFQKNLKKELNRASQFIEEM